MLTVLWVAALLLGARIISYVCKIPHANARDGLNMHDEQLMAQEEHLGSRNAPIGC